MLNNAAAGRAAAACQLQRRLLDEVSRSLAPTSRGSSARRGQVLIGSSRMSTLFAQHQCTSSPTTSGSSRCILARTFSSAAAAKASSTKNARETATGAVAENTASQPTSSSSQSYLVSKYRQMCSHQQRQQQQEQAGGGADTTSTATTCTYDPHQVRALTELDRLRDELLPDDVEGRVDTTISSDGEGQGEGGAASTATAIGQNGERRQESSSSSSITAAFGFLSNIFSGSRTAADVQQPNKANPPRGVYLHGGVGCGKTFCMDLFYDSLRLDANNGAGIKAQKVHFHSFMLNKVHKAMHEAKMVEGIKGDVLPRVIERILDDGRVICFDEFQVTDVADALILRRLFTGLLDDGAVIVATSNRPPQDLYLNGLQRDRFLPFIDLLEQKLEVVSMWDSETDYRLIQGEDGAAHGVYFVGDGSRAEFEAMFTKLTKGGPVGSTSLTTAQGRRVPVPAASIEQGVARFSFDDLCRRALGAADYIVLGESFHTVFVKDVPALTLNDVNVVRRLITFVDCMYEAHVKLIMKLDTLPKDIFVVDLDDRNHDEAFAFDRTRSRLEEMRSREYLGKKWVGRGGKVAQDKELSEELEYLHEEDDRVIGEDRHERGRHIRRHANKSQLVS